MTAVVLAEPHTPQWHAARRAGIGASEIAGVLGLSPWESPFSLFWRKKEGWETDESDVMRTGTILEPAIADWAAKQLVCDEISAAPLMAHPDNEWALATPDRIVWDYGFHEVSAKDPIAVVELKWTGSWDGWGEEGTNQIPLHYRCQVLWQCYVVGVEVWYLAVLGPSGFRGYQGIRDDKDIAVMVEAGRRFMQRLADDDPPPIDDHNATIDTLKRLHPDLEDVEAQVDDTIAAGYLRAVRMRKLAEKVEQRYAAQLRAEAGSARIIRTADGRKVATHVIADVPAEKEPRGPQRRDYLLAATPRGKKP
jgi:putative phage-type endonuclease